MARQLSYYLNKYHNKHLKKIRGLVNELLKNKTNTGIHDLRVQIKKLKAFYLLTEALFPSFKSKKHFRPFKKLAKISTQVRDLEAQLALPEIIAIKENSFYSFIKKNEKKGLKIFHKELKNWDINILKAASAKVKKEMKHAGDARIRKKIYQKLKENKEKIRRFSQANELKMIHSLHDLRKLAKEQEYNLVLYSRITGTETDKELKRLDSLQEAIGKWHDREITLELIDKFMSKVQVPDIQLALLRKKSISAKARQVQKIKSLQK